MTEAWRKGLLFGGGVVLGGVLVFAAYQAWFAPGPIEVAVPLAEEQVAAAAPAPEAAPVPAAPETGCEFDPVMPAVGSADGKFTLEAALAAQPAPSPSAFLAVAQEAASQKRPRDTEVALIAACRAAGRTAGVPST